MTPIIETERLILRIPAVDEAAEVARYFAAKREHYAPFLTTSNCTKAHLEKEEVWRERLVVNQRDFEEDRALKLYAFARADGHIVAQLNFTQIIRGIMQACYLGLGVDQRVQGTGIMTEAARAAIAYVFGEMGLHRIMANHLPSNYRSARVLARLGFTVEGLARSYLYFDGAWHDHVMNSLVNPGPSRLERV